VDWSPDGKFIVTGGQDDLVSIWAFRGNIVARCQGHSSWINFIMFDKYNSLDRCYRFGSVGEDTKLLLWEFSVNTIRRPRSVIFFFNIYIYIKYIVEYIKEIKLINEYIYIYLYLI